MNQLTVPHELTEYYNKKFDRLAMLIYIRLRKQIRGIIYFHMC